MKSIKQKKQNRKLNNELKGLLTFLKRTKAGKYALIEKSSFPYSRLNEQPETGNDEQFFYGLT